MICPNCKEDIRICLDEWGYTPFHIHCFNCNINIGAPSIKKCIDLFREYHTPGIWIEYYKNQIQTYKILQTENNML